MVLTSCGPEGSANQKAPTKTDQENSDAASKVQAQQDEASKNMQDMLKNNPLAPQKAPATPPKADGTDGGDANS